MRGVILYGPPASGKDTITEALTRLEPRCQLFRRLKAGEGKTSTYRMVDGAQFDELRARGDILWENERYGSVYAVDRPGLHDSLRAGIPVLHLGQPEAIEAIPRATPDVRWSVVQLWCPRQVAVERLTKRDPADVAARLRAWDETDPLGSCDISIDTNEVEPQEAAALILQRLDIPRKADV